MKDQPKNKFKVPKRQWKKWTVIGQMVFNMLYEHMNENPDLYRHPASQPREGTALKDFGVCTWNAAWMAADITSRGEKHYIKELMKELGV